MASSEPSKRVFIVDPSFQDWLGHHAPYDLSVLDALRRLGADAVILANQVVSIPESGDAAGAVDKVFSHTAWGRVTGKSGVKRWRHRAALFLYSFLVLPYTLAGVMVNIGLIALRAVLDLTGRFFNKAPRSLFRLKILLKITPSGWIVRPPSYAALNDYYELAEALEKWNLKSGDIIFAHMITEYSLPMWALAAHRNKGSELVLLFRYPRDSLCLKMGGRFFLWLLKKASLKKSVRGATDSAHLAGQYAALFSLPLEVFPIPHATGNMISSSASARRYPLKSVALGNARAEKGICEIIEAIKILNLHGGQSQFWFGLQVNSPDAACGKDVDEFIRDAPPNVDFYVEALAPADYEKILRNADVVLVPYWSDVYAARTSGVMIEALAMGKVIIGTKGTWMADELRRFAAGCELIQDRDSRALAEALQKIAAAPATYFDRAAAAGPRVRRFHNPDVLAAFLLKTWNG